MIHGDPDPQARNWLLRNNTLIDSVQMIARTAFAVVAVAIAFWQVGEQWKRENEQQARAAFRDYLHVSMNNPQFSRPDLLGRAYTALEYERYFWYVNLMSQTFEEVFAHVPKVEAWIALAEVQIRLHCPYFRSGEYDPSLYSETFQSIVGGAIRDAPEGTCEPLKFVPPPGQDG